MRSTWPLLAVMLLVAAAGLGEQRRPPLDAKNFPAHDSHQGVTIAAVPVPDTPAAEAIFGKKAAPTRAGFLPVELIITNERAESVEVALEPIVVVSGKEKFEQVEPAEIAWGLYPAPKPKRPVDPTRVPEASRLPKDKNREKREEAEAALRQAALRVARVAPGGYARGYLYYDLRRKSIELDTSSVYIPTVKIIPTGEGLLFFEISLKPYAQPAP